MKIKRFKLVHCEFIITLFIINKIDLKMISSKTNIIIHDVPTYDLI